jgi:hypothetical protein
LEFWQLDLGALGEGQDLRCFSKTNYGRVVMRLTGCSQSEYGPRSKQRSSCAWSGQFVWRFGFRCLPLGVHDKTLVATHPKVEHIVPGDAKDDSDGSGRTVPGLICSNGGELNHETRAT